MDPLDTVVAGLSCREVLHSLSDLLDGELAGVAARQVQLHLAGCDRCAKFGGRVGQLVSSLRQLSDMGEGVPDDALRRLQARLAAERHDRLGSDG